MLMQKSFSQYGIILRKKNILLDINSINNGSREEEEETTESRFQDNYLNKEKDGRREEEEMNEVDLIIKKKEEKEKLFNGVKAWTSMKIQLLAHSTHISRENNDLNSAVNTLCCMIRLMGELEKRQQDQLKSWTNSISFIDDKYDNNTQRIRNDSNDLDISEIGDDIKNMNYLQNDIRKLFLSSEGRKQITTELIAKKWNLHNNNNNGNNYDCDPLEMNYNETPILSTSNINRIGFSSSAGSFSLPGSRGTETGPGTGRSGSMGFVGRGSTTSRLSGGRRSSGNPSIIATFANDFESRIAGGISSRSSFKLGKRDTNPDVVTETWVPNSKSKNVSPSGLLKGTSLILQKELKKDFRIASQYDEKDIDLETTDNYNINNNSNTNSNYKSHRKGGSSGPNSRIGRHSGPGSVSSISFYTVFAPPSILGISANTEKRRQQNLLKKKNSYSTAGRLVNAQLQSYQTISNSASDAANYLSSIILPEDQLLPTPQTNSKNDNSHINNNFPSKFNSKRGLKGFNNISGSVMKAGLNLSNLSAPKMKSLSKSKLNSIALNGQMNVRTASPLPQQQQQQQQAVSVGTPSINSSSLKIIRDKSGEENTAVTMMTTEMESSLEFPMECSPLDSCLESLSRMLFEGGSTSAQQEEGIDLLGQLSREVSLISIIVINNYITYSYDCKDDDNCKDDDDDDDNCNDHNDDDDNNDNDDDCKHDDNCQDDYDDDVCEDDDKVDDDNDDDNVSDCSLKYQKSYQT